ncbi:hypothetical protein MA9V1_032 [Chryseobacterium phage MA9V-1]|nr:hypothetical protein MA9V1_032 [Chryseobacterium phage MA9V-1]
MIVLDTKDSSRINDIVYFEDTSIKLVASKQLAILVKIPHATFTLDNGDVFKFFEVDRTTGNITNKFTTFNSTSATKVGDNYLHIVNIMATSENEGQFMDVISGQSGPENFEAVLQLTTIDEEDRFAVALANNKFYINDKFLHTFKDADINEAFTDFKLLNEKRRELLLDLFSIKSFIGVYYGLVNALKYFGYDDDVIIKEFWTYFDSRLDDNVLVRKNIEEDVSKLPKGYNKTNMFNITYRINDVTGEYGPDDLPELTMNFFNDYEALVKMNNLRIILETYFLPAHAMIVEIVGEHISFYKSGMAYYFHAAFIHYYCTEVKGIYDSTVYKYHEDLQVDLWEPHNPAVIMDTYALRLRSIFPDKKPENMNNALFTFYEDNFAWAKVKFNQAFYDFMQTCTMVLVDDKNREILKIDDVTEPEVLLGFLHEGEYTLKTICTDKYNLIHVYYLKLTTEFIAHQFDVFTVKNSLNYKEPLERTHFATTKEAFEYFAWLKNAKAFNDEIVKLQYSGLQTIEAYASHKPGKGMQNYYDYKDGQYPFMKDMVAALQPYRFVTQNLATINQFDIDTEKYARIPKELYASLNKAYLTFYAYVEPGQNVIDVTLNGATGKFTFFASTIDLNSMENSVVRQFMLQANDSYNKDIGVLKAFDCYCYPIVDAETQNVRHIVTLIAKEPSDVTTTKATTSANVDQTYKNLISHSGAFAYFNVYDNMYIGKNIEIRLADKAYYYRSTTDIADITQLVTLINGMFKQYERLARFEAFALDVHTIFINGDYSFTFSVGENVWCSGSTHDHVVNDLIKIPPGVDIMQYSLVFAKINETAKSRPHDITWRLYENSGNDKNLVYTSTDYFFQYLVKDKSSYSLELEYYDKPTYMAGDIVNAEKFKHIVEKPGVFLTTNNIFDTLYKKFTESLYKYR